MKKVSSAAYVAAGKELLATAQRQTIPYVAGGMSLAGMDCQGLAEYLLIQCGIPNAECNLAGSNAHWRSCLSAGSPEECTAQFGSVPPGAWVFIVSADDSGAPAKYRGDGMGDANHMGVYLGDCVVHASASRGCVVESKFSGKTIRNGGWNRVGLPPWVEYGITSEGGGADIGGGLDVPEPNTLDIPTSKPADTVYWAQAYAANGKPVKMRAEPSRNCDLYKEIPVGEMLLVIGSTVKGGVTWHQVRRNSREWWVMADCLRRVEG